MKQKWYCILAIILCFSPIQILAQDELYLGGNSIGIEIKYNGVYVSGTYPINESIDPSDTFSPGDIIQQIDHQEVTDIQTFYMILKEHKNPINTLDVTLLRDGETIRASMHSIYDTKRHSVSCGLYIKEKMSGVGTMTYYDPSSQRFGALGHTIEKWDGRGNGYLYDAAVISYTKAFPSATGKKQADINYDNVIATIDQNTSIGIYGNYQSLPDHLISLPWAKSEEVMIGEAEMYTVLDGEKVENFKIEITDLHPNTQDDMKGIEFVVTDTHLLHTTGGIIQGMSGSPIVQNGKIVGAVTHVVTSDPKKGYGVLIEHMLQYTRSS